MRPRCRRIRYSRESDCSLALVRSAFKVQLGRPRHYTKRANERGKAKQRTVGRVVRTMAAPCNVVLSLRGREEIRDATAMRLSRHRVRLLYARCKGRIEVGDLEEQEEEATNRMKAVGRVGPGGMGLVTVAVFEFWVPVNRRSFQLPSGAAKRDSFFRGSKTTQQWEEKNQEVKTEINQQNQGGKMDKVP